MSHVVWAAITGSGPKHNCGEEPSRVPNCNASGNSPINRIERPNPRPYGPPRSEIPWLATEVVRKDEEAFTWRVPQMGGRSMKSQPTLPSGTTESAPRLLRSARKGVKP